ncbi:hypothetical protein [Cesiribacter sp. SM1]|uniref:hypothetical protein n=1 Tax=Cesiribacter sp. SM1 TaxID=2861196 RepID=UPI001CD2FDA2|nr:hypothetical protein [Cesiribacter sp. SM1]
MKKIILAFGLLFLSMNLRASQVDSINNLTYSKIILGLFEVIDHRSNKVYIHKESDYFNDRNLKDVEDIRSLSCHSCIDIDQKNKTYTVDSTFFKLWLKLDSINEKQAVFENKIRIKGRKVVMVGPNFSKGDGLPVLRKILPRPIEIKLSKIAYSEDRKYAMIYLSYRYNSLYGEGMLLLMNVEQDYNILKVETLWES